MNIIYNRAETFLFNKQLIQLAIISTMKRQAFASSALSLSLYYLNT